MRARQRLPCGPVLKYHELFHSSVSYAVLTPALNVLNARHGRVERLFGSRVGYHHLISYSTMRRVRIKFSPLHSSLVNLPLSVYGPLVSASVVSTAAVAFTFSGKLTDIR